MQDKKYMRRALQLAAKGIGRVNPNPLVGAVIVRDDIILAEGYHHKCGAAHAERNALCNCEDAAGATLYVNLEPCCHQGRTPPCTEAIIGSGISRVVVGMQDPNPLVAGQGINMLRQHGIRVDVGCLEQECRELNEVFIHYIGSKMPFVTLKYAMTADGKIATRSRDSRWISNSRSREQVQQLRHRNSAIMVGSGTVLADDPLLNCKLAGGRDPVRIICDSRLRLPTDAQLVRSARQQQTIVATLSQDAEKLCLLEQAGVQLLHPQAQAGRIDLKDLLRQLGSMEIDSILLEGGAELNYSMLSEGLVQKVLVYLGQKIFGGKEALSPVSGVGIEKVAEAFPLLLQRVEQIEGDVLLEYNVEEKRCLPES